MTDLIDPIEDEPVKRFDPTFGEDDDLGHGTDPNEDEDKDDRRDTGPEAPRAPAGE